MNQVANRHKTNRTMYRMSESVITLVGELRECSEKCLAMLDGKNCWYWVGDSLEQQNKVTRPRKLLGENKTRY